MCGILFHLQNNEDAAFKPNKQQLVRIKNRGPDSFGSHTCLAGSFRLNFYSSVLHLRGPFNHPTAQPHIDPEGNVLCWNGEIWNGPGELKSQKLLQCCSQNDGTILFNVLKRSSSIEDTLSSLQGPFAFVFYHAKTQTLYWGRDRLGMRSLVIKRENGSLTIASVAEEGGEYVNVEPGFHSCKLSSATASVMPQSSALPPTDYHPLPVIDPSILIPNDDVSNPVEAFHRYLLEAVRIRVQTIPLVSSSSSCPVAVLYSGGVDCTVLARLIHSVLDDRAPIDLLNVAFENPRMLNARKQKGEKDNDIYQLCPDRVTGLQGWRELQRCCPNRTWNFVSIDVPYSQVTEHRQTVLDLMFPNATVMDLSIALAFYFASTGCGYLTNIDGSRQQPYVSSAKVLFSGLGADEQLGGYSRHLRAFQRGGLLELEKELRLDITRIPTRNLGRDDRVISNQGKEVRYAFLDANVMAFLQALPTLHKMQLQEQGGDKLLLRKLCHLLGCELASKEKKRAIQFGSKSAKMESNTGRVLGHEKLSSR
ncbi:asparagine synthase [Schizosaccharomyces japonicus yFS275]|uniref:Asparagine synthase n=1 Tax=Schizosaccharomyces japonicus (strain yFS275 / FY16936) TaxID=402676 RepID=B6K1A7_SCHJY|nr:asparagine synthase [Schizosaccharomyces japonicus yFS275]EEB07728.1 asparagine synthase [Schizosaccharomyces japonicus yFS275]